MDIFADVIALFLDFRLMFFEQTRWFVGIGLFKSCSFETLHYSVFATILLTIKNSLSCLKQLNLEVFCQVKLGLVISSSYI